MDSLIKRYNSIIKYVSTKHVRNIYNEIDWNSRLIGIKGARGVGKTTLMLQRIVLSFTDHTKAIYISLDDLWFSTHNLIDLADMAQDKGITHLFIDEVHRLPGWERQIKNVYDSFPGLNIVFTGSSLLEIDHSIADLSRRCLLYNMPGLSFREFLIFEGINLPRITLSDILYNHERLAIEFSDGLDILSLFKKYLRHGYYPFYTSETEQNYLIKVNNIISAVIDYDVPAVENIEYATLIRMKQLLSIMAAQAPSPLNATALSTSMGISKNQVIKLLSLLDRSQILRLLYYKTERNPKSMSKPQKVLLNNTSIAYALGCAEPGKVRETFLASMLAFHHEVAYPKDGDLLVDNRYLFEVGGKGKTFTQIRNIPDSFIAADEIPLGFGNKIPLWIFGLIY